VGKDENGKWRSVGSDEYTSNLCGRLAHIVLDDGVPEPSAPATPQEESAGGGGEDFTATITVSGDVNENEPDEPSEIESSAEMLTEPFDAIKAALEANLQHPATTQLDAVPEVPTTPRTMKSSCLDLYRRPMRTSRTRSFARHQMVM